MYTGGIDNTIKVWDLRKEEVSFTLEGHGDTITGMRACLLVHFCCSMTTLKAAWSDLRSR